MSKRRRNKLHAHMKAIAYEYDDRPIRNKISREQWVVALVAQTVSGVAGDHVKSDDVASDILLELLNQGGFVRLDRDEIVAFCRKRMLAALKTFSFRREMAECDFPRVDGRALTLVHLGGAIPSLQPMVVDAHDAFARVKALPNRHRQALEILCDGGNPIDVAEEMEITPWAAVALIREARGYVDRVDPLYDAA